MIIMGVDVGQNGGLAVVKGRELLGAVRMPTITVRGKQAVDALAVIQWASRFPKPDHIVVELVSAMPRQGVASTFQFGRMLGGIECAVQPWQVPMSYITPAVWKKAMGLSSDKQASIDAAHTAFGERGRSLIRFKADDGLAEAALLALYFHQTEGS
jgi:crossover junction endodeoxyribonuclease RuvC